MFYFLGSDDLDDCEFRRLVLLIISSIPFESFKSILRINSIIL